MASPTPTLFSAAQKQIYNLMKFDSFSRFLKSELYREAVEAEAAGRELPYADKLDPDVMLEEQQQQQQQTISKAAVEKTVSSGSHRGKKGGEDASRRRSLLPWGNKDRSKSKERASSSSISDKKKAASKDDSGAIHGVEEAKDAASNKDGCTLARVILPDKATTVVQTRKGETIRAMVARLLEKRGLRLTSFDVFATEEGSTSASEASSRPLDLSEDCSTLGCTEVRVEPRVLFRLELPSGKSIGVKAKPAKVVRDVLGPILAQYGWDLAGVTVRREHHQGAARAGVDLDSTVASIDNSRLAVKETSTALFRSRAHSASCRP